MSRKCMVPSCGKVAGKGSEHSIYCAHASNPILFQQWVDVVGLRDNPRLSVIKNVAVCSRHFAEDNFEHDPYRQFCLENNYKVKQRRLREGTVPTSIDILKENVSTVKSSPTGKTAIRGGKLTKENSSKSKISHTRKTSIPTEQLQKKNVSIVKIAPTEKTAIPAEQLPKENVSITEPLVRDYVISMGLLNNQATTVNGSFTKSDAVAVLTSYKLNVTAKSAMYTEPTNSAVFKNSELPIKTTTKVSSSTQTNLMKHKQAQATIKIGVNAKSNRLKATFPKRLKSLKDRHRAENNRFVKRRPKFENSYVKDKLKLCRDQQKAGKKLKQELEKIKKRRNLANKEFYRSKVTNMKTIRPARPNSRKILGSVVKRRMLALTNNYYVDERDWQLKVKRSYKVYIKKKENLIAKQHQIEEDFQTALAKIRKEKANLGSGCRKRRFVKKPKRLAVSYDEQFVDSDTDDGKYLKSASSKDADYENDDTADSASDGSSFSEVSDTEKPKPEEIPCPHCDRTFAIERYAKKHTKVCSGKEVNVHKCDKCEFLTPYKIGLKAHLRFHDIGSTRLDCNKCSYFTWSEETLKSHGKLHSNNNPNKCDQCTYVCQHPGKLQKHMRKHTGEKPFKCKQCNYSCARKSALTIHQKRHKGIKRHKCPQCDFTSLMKNHLVRHLLTHTGEKPYKCTQCDFATIQKHNLTVHLRTHLRKANENKKVKS